MLGRMMAVCGVLAAGSAFANDSVGELGTGGIILSRTDAVSMISENLSISLDKVTVDYVFKNQTDKDVEALVAFPMPDIDGDDLRPAAIIPDDQSDNFLGFEVSVDGKAVKPTLEQKAFALGIDVRRPAQGQQCSHQSVHAAGVHGTRKAFRKQTAQEWLNRGLMFIDSYDDGAGWKNVRTPLWSLKSTYWWNSSFPAGKEVKVSHRYKPSVGGTFRTDLLLRQQVRRLLRAIQARLLHRRPRSRRR